MKPVGEYTVLLFVIFFVFTICQGHPAELQKVGVDESIQRDRNSCSQHLADYSSSLELHQLWALKMYDATTKMQSGILDGNLADMGDFNQCLSVTTNISHRSLAGKYCIVSLTVPLEITNENATTYEELLNLDWGICIPNTCTAEEGITSVLRYLPNYLDIENATLTFHEELCQVKDDVEPKITKAALGAIIIIAILVCLVISSSFYDVYLRCTESKCSQEIFLAFSVLTNLKTLFLVRNTADQIPCLNGMRVLSLMWIIFGHEYSIYSSGPGVKTSEYMNEVSFISMYIRGGSLAVDTFFVIGGILLGYGYLKNVNKGIPINLAKFYFHRIIRLLPALAMVVLVSATLLDYLGSGPYWPHFLIGFKYPCVDNWWSALLFIQNYVNVTRMCAGHSWYLNVDMQLFILSPLLLVPLKKYRKPVIGLIIMLILASIAASFEVAWRYDMPGVVGSTHGNSTVYSNEYYLRTHTRAAPWLIGLLCGFFIYDLKQAPPKMSKFKLIALWSLAACLTLVSIFCGYPLIENESKWGNSLYIALVRPVWSLGLCWIILACILKIAGPVNALLSLSTFQVLGRLVFGVYLIHVTMMYGFAYAVKTSNAYSNIDVMKRFWADTGVSTILATVLLITVEYPFMTIGKLIA